MKKLWLLFLFLAITNNIQPSATSFALEAMGKPKKNSKTAIAIDAATALLNAASTHYIINLTGRTIILNFYQKSFFNGKSTWYDSKTFGPLLLAGKATTNIVDTLNYQLLPTPIDMHTNTCFKVTVDAFKFNSTKLKDKSIHGTSMPTPATSTTPNDFKITLDDNDQLVITELDTCMGIKIPKAEKKQWPSKEELEIRKMTPEDKIKTLEQQNVDIEIDILSLNKKITNTKNFFQQNNRKKMIANKKEQIKKNKHTIAKLQEEVAKNSTTPTSPTPITAPTATPPATTDTGLLTEPLPTL